MAKRQFTIDEANALLPLFRQRLDRLQHLQSVAQEKYAEVEQLKGVGRAEDGRPILRYDIELAQGVFTQTIAEANSLVQSITDHGCELKNVALGLIDFPSEIDGQPALLCWQLGEAEILFFHSPHAGFQGRRPLFSSEGVGNGDGPDQSHH
ncbi:MAG: DUF2203 family protein [Sulfobacillus sp.]